jgi:integrase
MFKWAACREMLPVSVYQSLKTLEPLKRGRATAAESEPIKLVPPAIVESTRPFLIRQINALIYLQLLTGARGGELFRLRRGDIDRSRQVWKYMPADHKTAWR